MGIPQARQTTATTAKRQTPAARTPTAGRNDHSNNWQRPPGRKDLRLQQPARSKFAVRAASITLTKRPLTAPRGPWRRNVLLSCVIAWWGLFGHFRPMSSPSTNATPPDDGESAFHGLSSTYSPTTSWPRPDRSRFDGFEAGSAPHAVIPRHGSRWPPPRPFHLQRPVPWRAITSSASTGRGSAKVIGQFCQHSAQTIWATPG